MIDAIIKRISKEEDLNKRRHMYRMELEDPIFDYLRAKYGQTLKDAWESLTFPKTSKNTVLLVERREHPNIEFVLHNFMYFCAPQEFSLTIVCSDANEAYVRNILGKHLARTTILPLFTGIGTREQGRSEYNTLFTSYSFWEKIDAEYILSIQTDCYLRKPLPPLIWTVDYVAAPWYWKPVLVGGSGLTFRKKTCVLDLCRRNYTGQGEDVFFSQGCLLEEKAVLSFEEQVNIFSESCISDDPVGVHQWWTYFSEHPSFLKYYNIYTTIHCQSHHHHAP